MGERGPTLYHGLNLKNLRKLAQGIQRDPLTHIELVKDLRTNLSYFVLHKDDYGN